MSIGFDELPEELQDALLNGDKKKKRRSRSTVTESRKSKIGAIVNILLTLAPFSPQERTSLLKTTDEILKLLNKKYWRD